MDQPKIDSLKSKMEKAFLLTKKKFPETKAPNVDLSALILEESKKPE